MLMQKIITFFTLFILLSIYPAVLFALDKEEIVEPFYIEDSSNDLQDDMNGFSSNAFSDEDSYAPIPCIEKSPLMQAVKDENVKKVLQLIKQGANVKEEGSCGGNPFYSAVSSGNVEIAKILLVNGAEISPKIYDYNFSPLSIAVMNGDEEMVEFLIKAGANLNPKNSELDLPLHLAIMDSNIEIVKLLIKAGADLNAVLPHAGTPLMIACNNGEKDIVLALISAGADMNISFDYMSDTTLLISQVVLGNSEMAELLIKAGANVNLKDSLGSTALYYAVRDNETDLVKLLISAGADVNAGIGKKKPIYVADEESRKLLIDAGATEKAFLRLADDILSDRVGPLVDDSGINFINPRPGRVYRYQRCYPKKYYQYEDIPHSF